MKEPKLPEPALWLFRMPGGTEWLEAANRDTAVTLFRDVGAEIMGVLTAEQVRAAILAERERCAKVCEAEAEISNQTYQATQSLPSLYVANGKRECAAAIRRGPA